MIRDYGFTTTLLSCTLLALTTACGGNPVQPTTGGASSVVSTTAVPPNGTTAPDVPAPETVAESDAQLSWTVTGGHRCETSPPSPPSGVYRWTLNVKDAGPDPLHVIAVSHHEDRAGCDATEARPGPLFRMSGTREYAPHGGGQTLLAFDTRDQQCGRVQVDASLVDSDGRVDTLVVGEVINYGVDCKAAEPVASPAAPAGPTPPPTSPAPPTTPPSIPTPPASPVPPASPPTVPTPAPPTVPVPSGLPMCPATGVIGDVRFVKAGGSITATFTVIPGVQNAIISLATYRRDTPAFLPQSMIAPPVSGVFSSGGPYTLVQPVSSCRAQVDLIRCVVANEPLAGGNFADLNSRTMAWWYDDTPCP
jgi:hypothetical protein